MSKLALDKVIWEEFKLNSLFELKLSKGDNQANLLEEGHIPLISSGLNTNGITKFVKNGDGKSLEFEKNTITIDMFGKAFYHDYSFFSVSHGRVNILVPKFTINKYIALFLITIIDNGFSNIFSYNRMCSQNRLKSTKILLPATLEGRPNWQFMEDYIKLEMKVQSKKIISYYEKRLMDIIFENMDSDIKWKEFKIKDIFKFSRKNPKGLNNLEKDKKGISYLGATNRNNGVLEFVKNDDKIKYKGNCIAFIRNGEGSMGYAVYKREDFIATQDISVGYNENLDLYTGTFITTISDRVRGKYNFGYKRNQNRLENEVLHLPVDNSGNPNWEYMRCYMKKIEKRDLEKILSYISTYNK